MNELITQRAALTTAWNEYKAALTRPVGLPGTSTGFFDWDMVIGGWKPRKVNTIAMRSAMGKTATMVQISKAAGEVVDGRRSELCVATWEQAASELATRFVSHNTGLTIDALSHPYILTALQQKQVEGAYQKANEFPIHYHQYSSNIDKMLEILDKFLALVKGKETVEGVKIQPVFVLDYIGMAKGRSKYNNKTYDIADFLQELKAYSNTTNLCCLILAQINRSADNKDLPDIADISDSSSIEHNSDVVILGHRAEKLRKEVIKDPDTGADVPSMKKILWLFEKNRGGKTPHILGHCDVAYNRFWNRNHDWNTNFVDLYKDPNFWTSNLI